MFDLFRTRRFTPLFITQFFGAFNDNLFRNAFIILVTFKLVSSLDKATVYTNLAMAVFMLPYFLFSPLAGQISDKYNKAPLCKFLKFVEIILMIATLFALVYQSITLLLILLFFMGAQSAFLGPAKYSLLPQQLKKEELVTGNALLESGTFLAILLGTVFGGVLIGFAGGELVTGIVLILLAIVGFVSSWFIPTAPPSDPDIGLSANFISETIKIFRSIFRQPTVLRCVVALGVFWMSASLYMSQLPALCRQTIGGDSFVLTFYITLFSIGVAIGSLLATKILKGKISGRLASVMAFGMAIFTCDLAYNAGYIHEGELRSFFEIISIPRFWRIGLDLFLISVFGGAYCIPLQALMQSRARKNQVARVIAGSNILNSLLMASAAIVFVGGIMVFKLPLWFLFVNMAILNVLIAIYARRLRNCRGK